MLAILQQAYGTNEKTSIRYKLDMFSVDLKARVPDGIQDVGKWLLDNGLNPKTAKIVVIPSVLANLDDDILAGKGLFNTDTLSAGEPSPYWPFFDNFRYELRGILSDPHYKFISKNTFTEASKFITENSVSTALADLLQALKTTKDRQTKVPEDTLDKWYVEILLKMDAKLKDGQITESVYKNALAELDQLFNFQYSLYGHSKVNPLHRSARHTVYIMTRIVYSYKQQQYLNKYAVDDFLTALHFDPGYNKKGIKYDKVNFIPGANTWKQLIYDKDGVNSKIKEYLLAQNHPASSRDINQIIAELKPYIDNFVDLINNAERNRDMLNALDRNPEKQDLLNRIINCPGVPQLGQINNLKTLSKLLFNHPVYDNDPRYSSYINNVFFDSTGKSLSPIFAMEVRVALLERTHFKDIGLQISQDQLQIFKTHVTKSIYQFLGDYNYVKRFGSKLYNIPLVNKYMYNAISKLHLALAMYNDDPFLKISIGSETAGMHNYGTYLKEGSIIGDDVLDDALNALEDMILQPLLAGQVGPSYMLKSPYYYDAIQALKEYKEVRDVAEFSLRAINRISGPSSSGYSKLFHDKYYKSWNVITLLVELAATEPLSFEPLFEEYYDSNSGTGVFAPHHIFRDRKSSVLLSEQIMTYDGYNKVYDTMPETSQIILREGIKTLFQMGIDGKGSGTNGLITEDDIRRVFDGKVFSVNSPRISGRNARVDNVPIITEYATDSSGNRVQVSNLGLWDYHFTEKMDLQRKLRFFNEKIDTFRTALKQSSKQAYLSLLNLPRDDAQPSQNIVKRRFFANAERFANRMMVGACLPPSHADYLKISKVAKYGLGSYEHMYLAKLLFQLVKPLSQF